MTDKIRIENWSILLDFEDEEYTSPQNYFLCFAGVVFGHPKFEDGSGIKTSRIISYDEGVFKTVSGSAYILGKVNPAYEAKYPNAYSQLVTMAEKYLKEGDG
jgi:hypothetical protein